MSLFGKKPKDYTYDDSYDSDFYRGEEDGVVGGEEDGDELPAPAPAAPQKKPAPKAAPKAGANAGALKVVKPRDAQDGLVIADYLVHGYTVVMNIESLERDMTVRLIDFLQGALHVLDGELRRVTKSTFVLSPRKGEVSEDNEIGRRAGESDDYN